MRLLVAGSGRSGRRMREASEEVSASAAVGAVEWWSHDAGGRGPGARRFRAVGPPTLGRGGGGRASGVPRRCCKLGGTEGAATGRMDLGDRVS